MPVYTIADLSPAIATSCYIAPNASVIGSVALAENVSVWFGAILRADNDSVSIGANSNVQDAAVMVRAEAGLNHLVSEMSVASDGTATLFLDHPQVAVTIDESRSAAGIQRAAIGKARDRSWCLAEQLTEDAKCKKQGQTKRFHF